MRFPTELLLLGLPIPTVAVAEPLEGKLTGSLVIDAGEQVIQPIDLLGGDPTTIIAQARGGQIDCALLTSDGEPLAVDTDQESNECAFRVTPPRNVSVYFVVRNNGDEPAYVTATAE